MQRVRTGASYVFKPVGMDVWRPVHQGLVDGEIVTVVKLPGAPPPGTMGHAHVNGADGAFGGLVLLASLQPRKR